MEMSWTHQSVSRRRALAAATGLAVGALLPHGPALAAAEAYTNPVIWQDFADIDVIRVGRTGQSGVHPTAGVEQLEQLRVRDHRGPGPPGRRRDGVLGHAGRRLPDRGAR